MNQESANSKKLPSGVYRKFFMLTDYWQGSRVDPESLLVKIHSGGDAAPFFWVGAPNELIEMISAVGEDRSIYCIPNTVNVLSPIKSTIIELGQYFADEIVKANPEGPYLLGGLCNSAFTSYEIAKILEEKGKQVGLLLMIERDVTQKNIIILLFRKIYWFIETFNRWTIFFSKNPGKFFALLAQKFSQYILRRKVVGEPIRDEILLLPDDLVFDKSNKDNYKLAGFKGKVDLIYVKWGLLGYFKFNYFRKLWDELALNGANFHIIDGKFHMPPNWRAVATITKQILQDNHL
jgi:hypothetical protein